MPGLKTKIMKKVIVLLMIVAAGSFAMTSCGGVTVEDHTDSVETTDETTDETSEESAGGLGGLFGSIVKEGIEGLEEGIGEFTDSLQVAVDSLNAKMANGIDEVEVDEPIED